MPTKQELTNQLEEFVDQVEELECALISLEVRLSRKLNGIHPLGRKQEVLRIMQTSGHITVRAIAERIGISRRNVSSQLSYLRKDGYRIATDSLGRKFLEN